MNMVVHVIPSVSTSFTPMTCSVQSTPTGELLEGKVLPGVAALSDA